MISKNLVITISFIVIYNCIVYAQYDDYDYFVELKDGLAKECGTKGMKRFFNVFML